MSKIGIQCQGFIPDFEQVLAKKPVSIKLLGNALSLDVAKRIRQRSPNTLIVLRYVGGDQDFYTSPTMKARNFADEAYKAFRPFHETGVCDVIEGINEPIVRNNVEALALNDWQMKYSDIMRSQGYRVAAYNFSVGNPDFPLWQYLVGGIVASDYLALHEYSAPRMDAGLGFYCLRYRKVYDLLSANVRKPLLITECGIDGGVIAGKNGGYRKFTTIDDFINQLSWYDSELAKDDYVVAAHIFGYGMQAPWIDFGFDVASEDPDREKFIAWLGSGAVITPPQPTKEIMPTPEQVRKSAWNSIGVDFNSDAALQKKADELKIGHPVGNELYWDADGKQYVTQGFKNAFLTVEVGQWSTAAAFDWDTGLPYVPSATPPPPVTGGKARIVEATAYMRSVFTELNLVLPAPFGVSYFGEPSVGAAYNTAVRVTVIGLDDKPIADAHVYNLRPDGKFECFQTDQNGQQEFILGVGAKFWPGNTDGQPTRGPHTIFIGSERDNPASRISDALTNLGLPMGEHCTYRIEFKKFS